MVTVAQSTFKCILSSIQLILDDHIVTAQCKSDYKELNLNPEYLSLLFFSYLDDPEHLSLFLFIHCRSSKDLSQ